MGKNDNSLANGVMFGAGAYLGYVLVKWGVAMVIVLTICFIIGYYAISQIDAEMLENSAKDQVTYKTNCAVRSRPSSHSRRVGRAKAWKRFIVSEKKNGWLKIELPNGRKGWTGCVDRIIYNGATTGKTTIDI